MAEKLSEIKMSGWRKFRYRQKSLSFDCISMMSQSSTFQVLLDETFFGRASSRKSLSKNVVALLAIDTEKKSLFLRKSLALIENANNFHPASPRISKQYLDASSLVCNVMFSTSQFTAACAGHVTVIYLTEYKNVL